MASTCPSGFIVHIYKSEVNEIRKYQGQPCVGDLFGLWTSSGNVVVQLAVAGASLCGARQESEQDLKNYLEKKHMLCHVGKWQYDPNLTSTTAAGVNDPSTLTTVRSYCGNGYKACILLNLCGRGNEENVQPYLFLEEGTQHISATINILLGDKSSGEALNNPLRNVLAIREMVEKRNHVIQTNIQHLTEVHTRVNTNNSNSDSWVTFENKNTSRTQYPGPNAGNIRLNGYTPSLQPASSSSLQLSSSPTGQNTSSNPTPETPRQFLNASTGDTILKVRSETSGISSTNTNTTTRVQQPAPSNKSNDSNDRVVLEFSKEMCKNLEETFALSNGSAVNMQVKDDKRREKIVELTFEHYNMKWLVAIPVQFPKKPAQISQVPKSLGINPRWCKVQSKNDQLITSYSEILKTIYNKCSCTPCFKAKKG